MAKPDRIIMVAATADPHSIAGLVANEVIAGKLPVCRAIGAGAVNQMVKACAIARGYVAPQGFDLLFRPGFESVPASDPRATKPLTSMTMKAVTV
jgi:stage V sporulation protein S